jgi:hypothetical protein
VYASTGVIQPYVKWCISAIPCPARPESFSRQPVASSTRLGDGGKE